jgi:hypothetical protein
VAEFADPERRVLVCVDMERYSRRDNVLQHRAQAALTEILAAASEEAGLRRAEWRIQQAGDGEFSVLPAGTSERRVVAGLPANLDRLLRSHNRGLAPEARVRLRVAVHQGLVHLDGSNGVPGDDAVEVCRLADASELKEALRLAPGADVALIVSDVVYRDVVLNYRDLRPDLFVRVAASVTGKAFRARAWIHVPGENMSRMADASSEAPKRPDPAARQDAAAQVFRDITTHGPAQFGNDNVMHPGHPLPRGRGSAR